MTVLHLLGSAADGGAETYFSDLTAALARHGYPTLCALRPHAAREARLRASAVPIMTTRFGGPLDLLTRPRIARFAKIQSARILVAWMNRAAFHAPRGPWARIGRLGGYYDPKYYRGFDALVGNTADITRWIIEQGWPADRVRTIANFAATGDKPLPVDRASLDTPLDVPLLLGMGRLHDAKAHDVTLRALVAIPDAWLWIAGSGPLEAHLKALAVDLGVAERVRFLGWREDAPALYASADLCLFPSRFEPLGNVVIQSWAQGLPIIAAASQGPASLIRDGEDGVLVPIDDPQALATAALTLLNDQEMRHALTTAGRQRIESEFSEEHIVAQWRSLFQDFGA
jgi:glycosyltransferase involved in cell wall biosynthesis